MMLTGDQLARLDEDGYLHVPGVVPDTVLRAVEREYDEILSALIARLVSPEEADAIRGAGTFGERLVALASRVEVPLIPNFEISYPFTGIGESTPISLGDAVFELISCPGILDVVQSVIGAEISSNPVQHARIKLPAAAADAVARNGALAARTGWHQDLSAVLPEADLTDEVTVWVAMTDATEENGCLVYLPGSHRTGLAFHCKPTNMAGRGGSNIPLEYIYAPSAVTAPVSRGDILVHTMLTKHSSLDNRTTDIRWSFDLRYHRTGQSTGRPVFPSVVVRSDADPSTVVHDPAVWRARWFAARDEIAASATPPVFNRWNVDSAFC
jgi:phytanoyl-CoA hydroxylase